MSLTKFPYLNSADRLERGTRIIAILKSRNYFPKDERSANFLQDMMDKLELNELKFITEKQYSWLVDIFEES